MRVDYIVLAIPVFLALIGVELLAVRLLEKDYYRLSDSINDLSCGILDQLLEVFIKTALFAGYLYVYGHHRVGSIPASSAVAWIACFLGVDFFYYWFHRMSHEVNAFWAAHVVHHQSEEFNLAVALRQGALQSSFSWVFYLPLALAGFPPLMFLTCSSVNTLYQFWIHTRLIGRLGPLEGVLNTPSNHRVHHGRNPKYIDRNHGGILIVWDRLFGTYAPEEDEPVYGITTPLKSWNPVWANLHYWVELFGKARRTKRLADGVRLFVKPPGWHPDELGGYQPAPEVEARSYRKWETGTPRGLRFYLLGQFVTVLVAASMFLFLQERVGPLLAISTCSYIVASLVVFGALFEGKPWAFAAESFRIVLSAAAAVLWAYDGPRFVEVAVGAAVAFAVFQGWLMRFRPAAPAQAPAGS